MHPRLSEISQKLSLKKNSEISGLKGLAKAIFIHAISDLSPLLVVAPDSRQAENLLRDLRFVSGENDLDQVLFLPSEEKTPYHQSSPDPLVSMERLSTLHKLSISSPFKVLVASAKAIIERTTPFSHFQEMAEILAQKEVLDRNELIQKLILGGYSRVNAVEDPGTYAIRGSIIDLFWAGLPHPVRIDLFGDEIESIKLFDPQNQRTIGSLLEFSFGAAKEIHLNKKSAELAEQKLRDLADEVEYPTRKLREKLEDIDNKIPFFGIESLLPAFHDCLESPLELLLKTLGQNGFAMVFDEAESLPNALSQIHKDYDSHYGSALARNELCFAPQDFLVGNSEFARLYKDIRQISLLGLTLEKKDTLSLPSKDTASIRSEILREAARTDLADESGQPHHLLSPLVQKIRQLRQEGFVILLPVSSYGGSRRLIELLGTSGLCIRHLQKSPNLGAQDWHDLDKDSVHAYTFVAKPETPSAGCILSALKLCIITEDEIFGKKARRKGQSGKKGGFRTTLADLEEGDATVHVDHGIGIFRGLKKLKVRGVEQDYVLLTYAGDDKLYLPVHRINLIQAYSGAEGATPRLDRLGGTGWQSKKKKVKEAVLAMAQDLLNLYAKRELASRPIYPKPGEDYLEFESHFPFETTEDQQKAIEHVSADMQKQRPMDRLICGDVGYGKTEVAMRAAMLSLLGSRQTAILAPTTVLAQQHGITFRERFKNTAANIEVVSRFQKPKEIREILEKTKHGKVDILIGTHRLLSSDVSFKHLGLVVVDEEQRFGIKSKEHLKRLKTNTDVLTLSATPIPRTLQMGYFGLRDLSVIETPPLDRRAIRTSIVRFDDEVIREAIMREISRGGQVYFVHNRVSSISARADYLKRLIPEAHIEIGHGQMRESDLEKVMVRFMKHEFNVLVCTTIIETGIDVPSANTMFIDHADDFGLSQLYQLRGRIGRSKERAFAYLIIPGHTDHLTPIARKRLEILHKFSELGAGFRIAQHDLEIRGAGDLLGKKQHGHVAAVGYDLYAELLKEAVESLKGKAHEDVPDPDVKLPVAALVPDHYVPDLHDRMSIYQRMATATDEATIWDIIGSTQEQFGELPTEVSSLADVMILKQHLRKIAARGLEIASPQKEQPPKVVFLLGNEARINVEKLTKYIQQNPGQMFLTPQMKLVYTPSKDEWEKRSAKEIIPLCKHAVATILSAAGEP